LHLWSGPHYRRFCYLWRRLMWSRSSGLLLLLTLLLLGFGLPTQSFLLLP
jgi:hypothetical protein